MNDVRDDRRMTLDHDSFYTRETGDRNSMNTEMDEFTERQSLTSKLISRNTESFQQNSRNYTENTLQNKSLRNIDKNHHPKKGNNRNKRPKSSSSRAYVEISEQDQDDQPDRNGCDNNLTQNAHVERGDTKYMDTTCSNAYDARNKLIQEKRHLDDTALERENMNLSTSSFVGESRLDTDRLLCDRASPFMEMENRRLSAHRDINKNKLHVSPSRSICSRDSSAGISGDGSLGVSPYPECEPMRLSPSPNRDINKNRVSPSRSVCSRKSSASATEGMLLKKILPVSELEEELSFRENGFNQDSWAKSNTQRRLSSWLAETESLSSSTKGILQIEDDSKKTLREDDCAMSTILQPTAMLRREIALHEACKSNKLEAVAKILEEKIDINCKNNLDRTPLHWACAKGHLPVVELLVDHGADLEAKDKYGMRPVLWAALYGHIDVVRFLVNAGVAATCTNRQGMGLLHCATQNNHIHVMNFIFESLENVDINCSEKSDKTALHIAAEEGHLDAVMRLIDLRCDVNKRDKDCRSALHVAARQGHHEVVKRLLMVGVDVDDREAEGRTALHLAAEQGHLETVEVLADFNAGPNTETIKETTPLHCAAAKGHKDVCLRLIKHGANINSQNHQGNTALHLSVIGNYRDLTQALVAAKAEVDLPNHRLQTPLHVAVECGFQDVVEVLLVGNASLNAREKSGKTALHLAARGSFVTIVDMIVKAERYFSMNRDYHETDLDFVDPHRYLRQPSHPSWPQMKDLLWTLATKHLKSADWKKLAVYWSFTPDHIRCIEHQYTGTSSYKEHGFRLLMIWLHGIRKDENVTKLLFEALVAIDRRALAEQIRRKSNCEPEKPCIKVLCGII